MMDKQLLLKLLGKKNFTDLEDEIFNLRNLTNTLREKIILNLEIDSSFIEDMKFNLNKIYSVLDRIHSYLANPNLILGYTNSKKYLIKFVNSICTNIQNLLLALNPPNTEKITYYNNVLIDLILTY